MIDLVRIDIADSGTAEAVLQLQRRAYRVEAELIGSDRIPPLEETVEDLRRCGEEFVGAIVSGQLVGAISWRFSDGVIDIHRLVVDPSRHRQGIGTALVRHVLESERAADRAIVQTGAENAPAAALYLREGFSWVEDVDLDGVRVSRFAKRARY